MTQYEATRDTLATCIAKKSDNSLTYLLLIAVQAIVTPRIVQFFENRRIRDGKESS